MSMFSKITGLNIKRLFSVTNNTNDSYDILNLSILPPEITHCILPRRIHWNCPLLISRHRHVIASLLKLLSTWKHVAHLPLKMIFYVLLPSSNYFTLISVLGFIHLLFGLWLENCVESGIMRRALLSMINGAPFYHCAFPDQPCF